jgi:hypothetical protein
VNGKTRCELIEADGGDEAEGKDADEEEAERGDTSDAR